MTTPSVSRVGGAPTDPRDAALRKAAGDLQGLFVQQLYKTMRETVPTDGGMVERSQGEDVFASLMDERLAADTGTRWHRGLGDAIYRALAAKAGLAGPADVGTPIPPSPAVPDLSVTPLASPVRFP
ncbi:MAG: rod-binding protein [Gemmatimonadaceae bacterium]|nr:rod-binding protein [Gemmatimonadaceae bacterium]